MYVCMMETNSPNSTPLKLKRVKVCGSYPNHKKGSSLTYSIVASIE